MCFVFAFAAGAIYWTGTFVFGQEDKPAKTEAAAVPAATPPAAGAEKKADGGDAANGPQTGYVNIQDFSHLVADGDWSPAIQAAIDHVSATNGYENGATILFSPGTYLVNQTIRLGKDRAHYGTRLSGYGAVLKGTKILDAQSVNYEEREKALTEKKDKFSLDALPGELDFDGKTNVGVPILELWDPPAIEGANFVIEGLTFDREAKLVGVGIKVPAETVPKNITFRDVKINRQNVGVHINHCYQIRFESCLIRGNQIGIWGRNHFNSVSIINCEIRRQHRHGVVIGPNVNQWGNTGIHIAGNIFEEIKGYGILNLHGNGVTIIGNYFEVVGNSIGVLTPYWSTTIDTNAFMSFYGHGWNMNKHGGKVVADKAHIVIAAPDVQLRNNKYYGQGILLFGTRGKTTFDAKPMIAEGVTLADGMKVADSGGLGAYVYYASTGGFAYREFAIPTEEAALAERIRQSQKKLEAAKEKKGTANELAAAQVAVGAVLLESGDFDRARQEYEKAFQYPAANQANLRAFIQMHIANSYLKEKKYREAETAYAKALKIGAGGWHKTHCEESLKKVKELLATPKK
ncbi:MAG: right-handed parallel beta-helix repeat-containing protein [Planctomycetota bacterium]|nr:right-handed parallel beta-helix repeat-containing protein [Planctomycetota bacterium]